MRNKLAVTVGILNGLLGDYLARSGNGLATGMALVRDGRAAALDRASLAEVLPGAAPRAALLVHGVAGTEGDWTLEDGSDYGSLLARDLGFAPLYLRYNSGLAIADNGAALARLLETLIDAWPHPLEEIVPIGYSMGGLVVRSACRAAHAAGHRWLERVRRAIYVGTPHRGAPAERIGRVAARLLAAAGAPVTRLLAEIGNLRSSGIKDLGDADPVPLLPGIRHLLVAGTLAPAWLAALVGDGIVPVTSATNGACAPGASHVQVLPGVGHVSLARHPEVYACIRKWCEPAA